MDKNEVLHPDVIAAYRRGKVIADSRRADREASRAHLIDEGIADLQAKLDAYLKPGNATKTAY